MTDMNEWSEGLRDPADEEFDPARRRHKTRKGHLNAGLRRWLAQHRRGSKKYDPARHRKHRHHRSMRAAYDRPRHKGRRHRFSLGRVFHRRHYDFGRPGGWINAASGDITTMAGGQFHNFLTQRLGLGGRVYHAPNNYANITQLGVVTWLANIIGKKLGWWRVGGSVDEFLRGVNSEAVNIPMLEAVQRANVPTTASAPAGAPLRFSGGTGPAFSPRQIVSPINYSYVPPFAYE